MGLGINVIRSSGPVKRTEWHMPWSSGSRRAYSAGRQKGTARPSPHSTA
jgi:hypothetical protein